MSENCNCGCGDHKHHAEEQSKYDFVINEYHCAMSDKEVEEKVKTLFAKSGAKPLPVSEDEAE